MIIVYFDQKNIIVYFDHTKINDSLLVLLCKNYVWMLMFYRDNNSFDKKKNRDNNREWFMEKIADKFV